MRYARLRPVTIADAPFLFELLEARPKEMNISHRRMPTWEEHMAFIKSDPYQAWYVVGNNDGIVYLTKHDEIGIHLLTSRRCGLGTRVIKQLMDLHPRARYMANIAPGNEASHAFFRKLGFRTLQSTYEFAPVEA